MSKLIRNIGAWGLCAGLLVGGCDEAGDTGAGPAGTEGISTTSTTTGTPNASSTGEDPGESSEGGEAESSEGGETTSPTGPDDTTGSAETGAETGGSSSGTTGEVAFDEEFIWVADFLRNNCAQCHANDGNGNLVLPNAEITNDEVRAALDGIVANTGLQLVEPFDRQQSQTYLQITNEFGAQFPVEETDRFGEWIDAGANYFAE